MEIKIGVRQAPREIVIDAAETADSVAEKVTAALSGASGVLTFKDEKGRQVLVPADALAYVETGTETHRPVGFGLS